MEEAGQLKDNLKMLKKNVDELERKKEVVAGTHART
jgi:hypothetical protein